MVMHMKPDLTGIGRRIQKLRRQKGYTQEQLAEMLDIPSRKSIRVIENGHSSLPIGTLIRIAAALETPLAYFVTGTVPELPDYNCLKSQKILQGLTPEQTELLLILAEEMQKSNQQ